MNVECVIKKGCSSRVICYFTSSGNDTRTATHHTTYALKQIIREVTGTECYSLPNSASRVPRTVHRRPHCALATAPSTASRRNTCVGLRPHTTPLR